MSNPCRAHHRAGVWWTAPWLPSERRFKSGGSSAPPAVNPFDLANAQGQANNASAQFQSTLNNADTASPLGTSYFTQTPSGQWNLAQTLTPPGQGVLGAQQNLATQGAVGATQQIPFNVQAGYAASPLLGSIGGLANSLPGGPVNFSGIAPLQTNFGNQVSQAQNAAYNTQTGFLDPQFAEKKSDLSQQLADQGINPGSAAYDRAQGDLGRQSDLAYQQAQDAAVAAGNQEQQALFGESLQGRQEGVNEALQQYQSVPNAIGSLAGSAGGLLGTGASDLANLGGLGNFNWAGGVPTFGGSPTTVQPTNVVGAGQVAANNAANRSAAGMALNNQLGSGIGSLATGLGGSNLLFGSQGLGGLLGVNPTTGLLGGLFGGGAGLAGGATAGSGLPLGLAALGL
jgi:hypothetical protein